MSPGSMFSSSLSSFEAKLETRMDQLISDKTTDIVDLVSTKMEVMLNSVSADVISVAEKSAKDNQILADELIKLDNSFGTQLHTFQTQIKSLINNVKKGEEKLNLKNADVQFDLEGVKKSATEKSDELAALKLRVDQIEEVIRVDELQRKRRLRKSLRS